MFKKRKENLSSYVHVLHRKSRKEVLHRSRAKSMSKKCIVPLEGCLSLFPGEKNLVTAGHVKMCVNKLRSGGRSSTRFCPLDNEILSGVGTKLLLQNSA